MGARPWTEQVRRCLKRCNNRHRAGREIPPELLEMAKRLGVEDRIGDGDFYTWCSSEAKLAKIMGHDKKPTTAPPEKPHVPATPEEIQKQIEALQKQLADLKK